MDSEYNLFNILTNQAIDHLWNRQIRLVAMTKSPISPLTPSVRFIICSNTRCLFIVGSNKHYFLRIQAPSCHFLGCILIPLYNTMTGLSILVTSKCENESLRC